MSDTMTAKRSFLLAALILTLALLTSCGPDDAVESRLEESEMTQASETTSLPEKIEAEPSAARWSDGKNDEASQEEPAVESSASMASNPAASISSDDVSASTSIPQSGTVQANSATESPLAQASSAAEDSSAESAPSSSAVEGNSTDSKAGPSSDSGGNTGDSTPQSGDTKVEDGVTYIYNNTFGWVKKGGEGEIIRVP